MDIALEMVVIDCPRYVLAIPRGEIDAHTEPAFRRQLFDVIRARPLIIDLVLRLRGAEGRHRRRKTLP
jgi:anti-anti-sigma regulatory factor